MDQEINLMADFREDTFQNSHGHNTFAPQFGFSPLIFSNIKDNIFVTIFGDLSCLVDSRYEMV